MVENPNLVLQATWFEAATYLHGEGRVRVCEDFFMSALSRGFEDHQRIGRTCGRKELSGKLGTDFLAHVKCHLSLELECLANISVPPPPGEPWSLETTGQAFCARTTSSNLLARG